MKINYLKKGLFVLTKSSLIFTVIASSLLFSFPASACGCGMLITSNDTGAWAYGEDSVEQSFINFENGSERLIIGLDIKNTSRNSVLVIPVPSTPEMVKADVLSEIPRFNGYNVSTQAEEHINEIREALIATQIYPVIPFVLSEILLSTAGLNRTTDQAITLGTTSGGLSQDVVVYQHLEKNGMIAEVLSAATSDSLYEYLTQKGLAVEKDSIPVFRDYIKKDFSFVVSWINPSIETSSAMGIMMTFPAKEIFYPLKPGSAYSGQGTSKTITVAGYVSPKLYSDIKDSTNVEYFYSDAGSSLADFFTTDNGFGFTKIIINAPPQKLTQDLYISNHAPIKILNAQIINQYGFFYGVVLLILISFVSTYLALRLLFSSTVAKEKLMGLSIASCFTLIGTIVGSRKFLVEKRTKFVILFSVIFIALTIGSSLLLSAPYQGVHYVASTHSNITF